MSTWEPGYSEDVSQHVMAQIRTFATQFVNELQNQHQIMCFTIQTKPNTKKSAIRRSFKHKLLYTRMWVVLAYIYRLIHESQFATLREIYYHHLNVFTSQSQMNALIPELMTLFPVYFRSNLHIHAGSKGLAYGHFHFRTSVHQSWQSNIQSNTPMAIGGNPNAQWQIQAADAQWILVIEKEGILQRLRMDGFCQHVLAILVTAKGFPDLASRAFIHHLHTQFQLPVIGLVDWNPHGVAILCTYRFGKRDHVYSESLRYTVPIQWAGIHSCDLPLFASRSISKIHCMTARDVALLTQLLKNSWIRYECPLWHRELVHMQSHGHKYELQDLFSTNITFLSDYYTPAKLLKNQFI